MWRMTVAVLLSGLLVMLAGCTDATTRQDPVRASSKYAEGTADSAWGLRVKTIDEAQAQVEFDLLVPTDTLGSSLRQVTVRDRSGNDAIPKSQRGVEISWDEVTIAEAPFPTADEAQAFVENIATQPAAEAYVKSVKVRGVDGLAWAEGIAKTDSDVAVDAVTVELPSSTVIWSEDRIVYRLASESVSWQRLLAVANSLK